jgi:zinc carboxypeptidase
MQNKLKIDSDFSGGNIVIDSIEGDVVKLHQDLRDTEGDWCYWYFRIRGAQKRKLTFEFTKSMAVGVNGAAVSLDQGQSWHWSGKESVDGNSFKYEFEDDADEVHFCMAIPYLEEGLNNFFSSIADNRHLKVEILCNSEQGRDVELIRLGCLDAEPKARILLTCRHHCCEMMASYVLEGIMDSILAGSGDEMKWLRENVEFMVIPFVDKDGVENGDQGKNRRPHDHNRDYGDSNIYNSVKTIRDMVPLWADGILKVALDMHCPYLSGGAYNEIIYMVGSDVDETWQQQQAFSKNLAKSANNSLPFSPENNLPFGEGWNVGTNYSAGKSFAKWAGESIPGIKLPTTIEIPYSNAGGVDVTQQSARAFGEDIAKAFYEYLQRW